MGETSPAVEEGGFFALAEALGIFKAVQLSGDPSDRALAKAAGVSATTVGDWLRGKRFPQEIDKILKVLSVVRAVAAARGISEEARTGGLLDDQRWRAAHWAETRRRADMTSNAVQRAQAERMLVRHQVGQVLAEAADPFALEVHLSVQPDTPQPGLPALSLYVGREHDADLEKVVLAASQGRNGIAVLVGGSSTGKTRACWEAVRGSLANWRIWHPIAPAPSKALLAGLTGAEGRHLAPRTVLWLNELQRYLLTADTELGECISATLRSFLHDASIGPFLILGTIWPEDWHELTRTPTAGQADLHPQARALLAGSQISVPTAFSEGDMTRLRAVASEDPRLMLAAQHGGTRIVQFLAGGFELIQRYESAPSTDLAVLHAASDASRLGLGRVLSENFLAAASEGYLADADWRRLTPEQQETWFADALVRLRQPCKGVPGPLAPARTSSEQTDSLIPLELADYLDEHIRSERRFTGRAASLWSASTRYVDDTDVLIDLGHSAANSLRKKHAYLLFLAAFERNPGSADALFWLINANRKMTESAVQRSLETGNRGAVYEVARRINRHSADRNLTTRLFGMLYEAGEGDALYELAVQYENANMLEAAEEAFRIAEKMGNAFALYWISSLRQRAGDQAKAAWLAEEAAQAGHLIAACDLAELREKTGDHAGAVQLYERLIDKVDPFAMNWYLAQAARAKGIDDSPGSAGQSIAGEHVAALYQLALWQEGLGNHGWSADLREKAENATLADTLHELITWRYDVEDSFGVSQLYEQSAAIGDPRGIEWLAQQRERCGDIDGADQLYRDAADAGAPRAISSLMHLRERAGDPAEADQLAETILVSGDWIPVEMLARERESAGDEAGAQRLFQLMSRKGSAAALHALGRLYAVRRDLTLATNYHRRAADAGVIDSLYWLARQSYRQADHAEADRLLLRALSLQIEGTNQNSGALSELRRIVSLREEAGDRAGAEGALRIAVGVGYDEALIDLALLRESEGDQENAIEIAYSAPRNIRSEILKQLALRRKRSSDMVEAERLYRAALNAGDIHALKDIAEIREQAGDLPGARQAVIKAVNAGLVMVGGWYAGNALFRLYADAGDPGSANAVRKYGLAADGAPAAAWEVS